MVRRCRLAPRARAQPVVFLAACIVAATLAACAGSGRSTGAGTPTREGTAAPPSTAPAPTTAVSASCRLTGGTTGSTSMTSPSSAPGGPTGIAYLTAVRAAVHEGCDRVVFEFREPVIPSVQVGYQSPPFTLGQSNQPVTVQGSDFLVLRFERASGVDLGAAEPRPTYTGPESIPGTGLTHVREIRRIEDFEAVLRWVIGLDSKRSYTVSNLSGPPRVYVDIA